jgi:D-aminopeptidase
MEGIQEGFDFTIFLGYHSSSSKLYGHLAHTYSETDINILIASNFGVPVGIISGDKRLFEELENFDGEFVIGRDILFFRLPLSSQGCLCKLRGCY